MHMQGTPQTMQQNPQYENVVREVYLFFEQKIIELRQQGVENIILDPGFGFGKTLEHNYQLLKHLSVFKQLKCALLAGVSRKSMINKVLKTTPVQALNGTTALTTIALLNGANIIRAHDVREAGEVISLTTFYSHIV
jgi:dihydropteroate synthase